MKLYKLECPGCGASLEIKDTNREFAFCEYCGSKIYIDKEEVTINKNININKTTRIINEAEILKAEAERKDRESSAKMLFAIVIACVIGVIILMLIPVILSAAKDQKKKDAISDGKITAGNYEQYISQNYRSVSAQLESAGFTDIEVIDLDDAGFMFWNNDKTISVSIGGISSFDSTDYFYPNEKVIITCH